VAALLYSLIVALILILAIGLIGLAEEKASQHRWPSPAVPRFAGVPTFHLEQLERGSPR
jgi:hypothetical protein